MFIVYVGINEIFACHEKDRKKFEKSYFGFNRMSGDRMIDDFTIVEVKKGRIYDGKITIKNDVYEI